MSGREHFETPGVMAARVAASHSVSAAGEDLIRAGIDAANRQIAMKLRGFLAHTDDLRPHVDAIATLLERP